MKQRLTISIIGALTLAALTSGCGNKKAEPQESTVSETQTAEVKLSLSSVRQIGLAAEKISRKPFVHNLQIPAKVLANQDNEALVGTLVPGRVKKVFVTVGDFVTPGKLLMLVEGLEIGQIKAGYLTAKANLDYQKSNYERQKKLLEENVGTQKTVLESLNEYDKARAQFSAEKNRISAIGLSDSSLTDENNSQSANPSFGTLAVTSPIGGIIVERSVVNGQSIDATSNAFKIINLSSVWVDGQLYEKDLQNIHSNATVVFSTSSYPDKQFIGKITYIGQIIDEKTRTLTVRAEFSNANGQLKPQMFGEMKIANNTKSDAILIPSEALVKIDNADFVFIQKNDSLFEKRAIVVGATAGETAEIEKGIADGELVVVKGAFYLKSELLKASLGGE